MNKVYKSVWNATAGTYVAAAETTKGSGKKSSRKARNVAMLAAGVASGVSLPMLALSAIGASAVMFSPEASAESLTCIGGNGFVCADPSLIDNWGASTITYAGEIFTYSTATTTKSGDIGGDTYFYYTSASGQTLVDMSCSTTYNRGTQVIGNSSNVPGYMNGVYCPNESLTPAPPPSHTPSPSSAGDASGDGTAGGASGKYFKVNSSGENAAAHGIDAIAIGQNAWADGQDAVAVGRNAYAQGTGSLALGLGSLASGSTGVAIGANASALMDNSVALGSDSIADRANTVSVGSQGAERQITNVAAGVMGTDAVNVNQLQAAIASSSGSGGAGSQYIAIGATTGVHAVPGGPTDKDPASATGWDAMAVGAGAVANGVNTMAIGMLTSATVQDTSAIGFQATAAGKSATAVGSQSYASGTGSVALGTGAIASGSKSVALGLGTVASRDNSVAVGSRQITDVAAGTQATDAVNLGQLQAMGANVDSSGNVTGSFVSYNDSTLGTITLKGASGTKITNLAAGTLSASSTDAVNGSQLFQTNQNVTNVSSNLTNVTNNLANITNTVNNIVSGGGSNSPYVKVAGANDGSDNASVASSGGIAIGSNANVPNPNGAGVDQIAIGHNATSGTQGWTGSIAMGGSSTAMYDGIALGYGASASGSGTLAVGRGASATATNAMAVGKNATASATNSVALGQGTVASRNNTVGVGSRQITDVAAGTEATDAVNLGQLKAMGANVDSSGNVTGSFVAYNDSTLGTITLKGASGTKITGLTAGTLSASSTDAVNGSQLFQTNQNVTNVSNNLVNVTNNLTNVTNNLANVTNTVNNIVSGGGAGSPDGVKYDTSAHTSLTLGGTGASAPVALTNVAAGQVVSGSKDAVNGGQLYNTASSVAAALGGGTTVNKDGTITAPTYDVAGNTYNNMGDAINAIAGPASSIAKASNYIQVSSTADKARAQGTETIAIGGNAFASGDGALAIGSGARAQFDNSVALGVNSKTYESNTVSVGAKGAEMRITNVANAINQTDAVTLAQLNAVQSQITQQSSGVKSMMLGSTQAGSPYIVVSSNVTQGTATYASDDLNAMAIGPTASASGINSMAVGAKSVAGLAGSTAVGSGAAALAANATVIGSGASTTTKATNAVAIGYNADTEAANTMAFGSYAAANADSSVAIGANAFTTTGATNSIALGTNASASQAGSVALGYGSSADRVNVVSVGSSTLQRQIINVAAGTKTTDAVNVSQLSAVTTALGGGAAVAADGSITKPSYSVGGQTYTDVGAAIAAAATGAGGSTNAVQYDTTSKNKVTLGGTGANTPVTLTNVANGTNASDAVNLAQLQAMGATIGTSGVVTNSFVAYDDSTNGAITLKGTGGTKIKGVAAGTLSASSNEAVNGTQLYQTNQNVANVTTTVTNIVNGGGIKYFHAVAAVGTDGDSVATAAGDVAIGARALAKSNGSGAALAIGSDAAAIANSAVAVGPAAKANGFGDLSMGVGAQATGGGSGKSAVALGYNANATAANSVALGANSVAGRANAVSVGAAGSERQIINVANGTNATDAINLSQLQAMGATIGTSGVVTNAFVAYDDTSKSKVTFGGAGASKPVTLSNVAAGVANTDAVNLSQLKQMGANVDSSGNVTGSFVGYDDASLSTITLKGSSGTKITGVKAGDVSSAASMDAVNGGQLYQTNQNVANVAGTVANMAGNLTNVTNTVNNITNGGGIKYFHANSTLADSTATGTNSVAIGGAANANASNSVALGANSVAGRANTVSVGAAGSERQIINVANGTNATDAINLSQLQAMGATIGTSGVVTNTFVAYDDTSKSKVTFGGASASKAVTLSNVAAGVANTDAVNLSQLKQMGVNVDSSGNVTGSFVGYDDATLSTITLKGSSGTKITGVKAGDVSSAGSMDAVNGGQLYQTNQNVANVAGTVANVAGNLTNVTNTVNNITNGGGIKYFHANSMLPDSTATGTNAVAIGGAASATANNSVALGSSSVANRANAVSVGAAGAERQIINVANGTNATDAVNVQQLQAMGASVDTSGHLTNAFVAYNDTTKSAVTLGGVGSNTPVTMMNLAAGQVNSSSHDAVNGSQLYNVASSVASALGGGAGVGADGKVLPPTYTVGGGTFSDVGQALNGLNGVISGMNQQFASTQQYIKVVSVADGARASGEDAIAIGGNSNASGDGALAIGAGARAKNTNSMALGTGSMTYEDDTVSVGVRGGERRITNLANGVNQTDAATVAQLQALQTQVAAQSSGVKSMLLGASAVTDYIAVSNNVTQGTGTNASNDKNTMAIGPTASASGDNALAVGAKSVAGLVGATAVGSAAAALAANTTVIGAGASTTTKATNAVAIGYNADAEGANTMAFGTNGTAMGDSSIAIGYNAGTSSAAANSIALGSNSTVSQVGSVALGTGSVADRANSVSVGSSTQQRQIINVAAGTQNTDAVNLGQMNAAIAASGGGSGGGSPDAVVYDTSAHTKLTLGGYGASAPVALTNVAAGQITSSSSDAVNGAQLYNTANSVAAALGGGSAVGTDGKVSKPAYTLNGSTYNDVGAALAAVAAGGGSGSPDAVKYDTAAHDQLTLGNAGKPVTVSNVAAGVANTDAVNVQQLKALGASFDTSGQVTGAFVAYDDASKGIVTFGGSGATTPVVLANVANGQVTSGSKQAINGSQLYGAMSSTAAALGGGSTVGSDGKVSKPTYSVGGSTYNGVDAALAALDAKSTTGSPDGVVYDSAAHDTLTLGNKGTAVTVANVADAKSDDEAVNLKQLKEAGFNLDTSGNLSSSFISYDDASKKTLTFGTAGNPTQLKNVMDASDDNDAVNYLQMRTYVNKAVSAGDTGGGTANGVAYDDSSKSKVTLGGVGSTTPVTLTNVAAGSSANDAVNYSQFSSLESQVNNLSNGGAGNTTYVNIGTSGSGGTAAVASGTDAIAIGNGASATGSEAIAIGKNTVTAGDNSVAMGSGASAPNANSVALGSNSTTDRDNSVSVGSAGNERQITNVAAGTQATDAVNLGQLNNAMGGMQQSINNVDRSAAKGIASASALNIVTPYLPGRTTLNAGVANYRGYQAVGLGVSRWNEKGTVNYNLGVSTSGGNSTIVRAGIGIVLGN